MPYVGVILRYGIWPRFCGSCPTDRRCMAASATQDKASSCDCTERGVSCEGFQGIYRSGQSIAGAYCKNRHVCQDYRPRFLIWL